MAITLAEVQKNTQDALEMGVIDEFRKSSFLLENMPFADAVSPVGGGAAMVYAYTRLVTQPTAAFRAINSEYAAQEVTRQRCQTELKVFGGAFEIDRVLAEMGGVTDEVTLQMQQKIKAAQALFSDTVVNGDSAVDQNAFDGLEKALTGSSTEINGGAGDTELDLSTGAQVTSNYMAFLDLLDEFVSALDGAPTALLMNGKMAAKLRACARRASMYQCTLDSFGSQVERYGAIPFIDLGAKAGSNDPIIPISAGATSLYAVRLGLDGFHGVSVAGASPIRTFLPDFTTPGAVKRGEVEMVAGVALKATRAAAVLRKIKVA